MLAVLKLILFFLRNINVIILLFEKLDMTVSKVAVRFVLYSHTQVALVSWFVSYFVVF